MVSEKLLTPSVRINEIARKIKTDLSPEYHADHIERVERIASSARQLTCKSRDLLDYANILSGTFELQKDCVCIRKVCVEVIASSKVLSDTFHPNIILDVRDNVPICFLSDKERIYQILSNLMSNSLRYSRSD
jgi:signal transduction histidine kinase